MQMRIHRNDEIASDGHVPDRLPGLTRVRVWACLAVVALHAAAPYLIHPMYGLVWSVRDQPSRLADMMFWTIEMAIMPVFLVMAGFFAASSLRKLPPAKFLRSKMKRLGRPLLFGLVVILPAELYIWTAGWIQNGLVPPVKIRSLKFGEPLDEAIWGTSHLWFLVYLLSYLAILVAVRRYGKPIIKWNSPAFWWPTLLICGIIVLTFWPEVLWGFQHRFEPVASKWLYNGLFFLLGVITHERASIWNSIQVYTQSVSLTSRVGMTATLAAATLAMGFWVIGTPDLSDPSAVNRMATAEDFAVGLTPTARVSLATLTVGTSFALTLLIFASGIRSRGSVSPKIEYLAAASFWIYLVHHPIVGLIHVNLVYLWPNGSAITKFVLSMFVSTLLSVGTYETWIRRSRFGNWLGFSYRFQDSLKQCLVAGRSETSEAESKEHQVQTPVRVAA
ncbi:MAG: acyltransferase family protein [Planctomycetota bacterium]